MLDLLQKGPRSWKRRQKLYFEMLGVSVGERWPEEHFQQWAHLSGSRGPDKEW